ncbi:hypothetical protein GCM10023237_09390 [Streptomyces coeruleoprunus]
MHRLNLDQLPCGARPEQVRERNTSLTSSFEVFWQLWIRVAQLASPRLRATVGPSANQAAFVPQSVT